MWILLSHLALRLPFVALGLASATWSLMIWESTWRGAKLETTADRIKAGDTYKPETLYRFRPVVDTVLAATLPQPDSLRSAALMDLRLAELDVEGGKPVAGNLQFGQAEYAIRKALSFAPSDTFLWAALFWLAKTRDGFHEEDLGYLRMSYATGPHEGWVAVRRSRLAVALLPLLPFDLKQQVLAEFQNLVLSNDIGAAATILTGPGWGQRDELIDAIADTSEDERRRLADAVFSLGFELSIPGIPPRGSRPWK